MNTPTPGVAAAAEGAGLTAPGLHFGCGGSRPYDSALEARGATLHLRAVDNGSMVSHRSEPVVVDVGRFLGAADRVDRAVLARTRGPVLDVGSGPGRMVSAALRRGRRAIGIDVSHTAVALAHRCGLPVVHGSVFDDVPGAGEWETTLLLDGNIGIGGDPAALLERCAELTSRRGVVVVETHVEPSRDLRFVAELVEPDGPGSASFPWAEAGAEALQRHAATAGLRPAAELQRGGRSFVFLRRRLASRSSWLRSCASDEDVS